ncbi:DUF6317 family protein [Streptomyces violascens]|uniref:DUF6317 family protein n=1 Tax=Streptomyces violascens TaxID=67381 RepID=UPI00366676A1
MGEQPVSRLLGLVGEAMQPAKLPKVRLDPVVDPGGHRWRGRGSATGVRRRGGHSMSVDLKLVLADLNAMAASFRKEADDYRKMHQNLSPPPS